MSASCRIVVVIVSALWALGSTAQAPTTASGWTNARLTDSGLSEAKLRGMSAAICLGQFKKIGSVLICPPREACIRKLVDGDANSLRDTRSATKSIPDILVRIAIQEHKLSGWAQESCRCWPIGLSVFKIPIPASQQLRSRIFLR